MTCVFCDSLYHLSQNCDIYETSCSRKKVLYDKGFCLTCLEKRSKNYYWNIVYRIWFYYFHYCKKKVKCYICFNFKEPETNYTAAFRPQPETKHMTAFCPHAYLVPHFYLPQIDHVLLSRFFQVLSPFEKATFKSSFPRISSMIKMETCKFKFTLSMKNGEYIPWRLSYWQKEEPEYHQIIIKKSFQFNSPSDEEVSDSINLLTSKIAFIQANHLDLRDTQLKSSEFLLLLTTYVQRLICFNVKIAGNLTFFRVSEKVPNIQQLMLYQTDIKLENSWANDLLKNKQGSNFISIELEIADTDFDAESLIEFVKTKFHGEPRIRLSINRCLNFEEIVAALNMKFSSHLVQPIDCTRSEMCSRENDPTIFKIRVIPSIPDRSIEEYHERTMFIN